MSLVEKVKAAGVVGAGGGGFPTHVKLSGKADTVIANGAECEPLLHKDAAVMEIWAVEMVRGMQLSMEAVGAERGFVGIKEKNAHAIEAVEKACEGTAVSVHRLGDFYPAGDEFDLVYEVTGRLIPPTGIPLHVGCVVANVETFVNIALADEGEPVISKTLTVTGAVHNPITLTVPVGTTFRDAIEAAGGATVDDFMVCVGGLMMGTHTDDLDTPVTKIVGGLIVLPREHDLIQRKVKPLPTKDRIGKSSCDQCRFCTELCPRYLLGYAVEPHQVMRSLAFTKTGEQEWNNWAELCCGCNLCSLYACPEMLYPKEACDTAKDKMREANIKWASPDTPVKVHPMREGRRTPVKSLMRKLGVAEYNSPAPWQAVTVTPDRVILPLKQAAGAPAQPVVSVGDTVEAGTQIGQIPEGALGAAVHAPFAGTVTNVTEQDITIERIR